MKTEDVVWVENHLNLLYSYINQNYSNFDHREYMESLMLDYNAAYNTRTILEDYQKSNDEKLNYFLSKFKTRSLIVSVIADRGQGKTAFEVWAAEELHKQGQQIYALYPFPQLPFVKIVYDISEVPENSILLIDELAKKYKARDFSSEEALALIDELIGLRHKGISIIGLTQDLSLVDINFVRMSDITIWKYYNSQKSQLTREGFLNPLIMELMPKKDEINNVLINDNGELSTFIFSFSDYSKDISKYLQNLSKEKEKIIKYLQKYHKPKEIIKLLHTQYNIRLSIEEQMKLLKN